MKPNYIDMFVLIENWKKFYMNAEQLCELLSQDEGLKLDFKREYKLDRNPPLDTDKPMWIKYINGQWDELIKDVIALANGNVGTADQVGILIIGAEDKLQPNGTRGLYDVQHLHLTAQQIIDKVNKACEPPIPNIFCEKIQIEGSTLYVISIPPSPYVHEISRQLTVVKGDFDNTGKLTYTAPEKVYTEYTAFIRKGEGTFPASMHERRALEIDKKADIIVMNENLKFELINNLRELLTKSKSGISDPSLFYRSFKENYKIEHEQDILVEGKYIVRLTMAITYSTSARHKLSTQFIDHAISSGRYLSYNVENRKFERDKLLTHLYYLQDRIRSFKLSTNNPEIHQFIVKYNVKDRRDTLVRVSFRDIVWVAAMLDLAEDVIHLSAALLGYLLGDKDRLDNVRLNTTSPIHGESDKIRAETPEDDEIIKWVLNHQKA